MFIFACDKKHYFCMKQEDVKQGNSIVLPNDIATIPQLSEFVETTCETAGVDDMAMTMSLNLALEEAVVNVMDYAYPAGTKGEVTIEAFDEGTCLKFVISDHGTPFDPTQKADIDTTLPAEKRSIGGLGIHLVRQIMDTVSYCYVDGQNILTLIKKK